MAESNGKGGPGWSTAIVLTVVGMVLSGSAGFYGAKEQAVSALRAEIQQRADALRQENRERFLTREEWANWKADNRARADAQYFALMTAIQRIGARLSR